jgi:hypothetical protein
MLCVTLHETLGVRAFFSSFDSRFKQHILSPILPVERTRPRHLYLLVRRTHQHPLPVLPCPPDLDDALARAAHTFVRLLVEREPEAGGGADDGGAERRAALADAAGEDERVRRAAEREVVRAEEVEDAVREEVEREPLRRCAPLSVSARGRQQAADGVRSASIPSVISLKWDVPPSALKLAFYSGSPPLPSRRRRRPGYYDG